MFERYSDEIVAPAPKESKQKRSMSEDLNQHLTWLQKRLKEKGEEFIDLVIYYGEKVWDLNTLLFPESNLQSSKENIEKLKKRIIETLVLAHAFSHLDKKEDVFDRNERSKLFSMYSIDSNSSLDSLKTMPDFRSCIVPVSSKTQDNTLLVFPHLTQKDLENIVTLYNKHYPKLMTIDTDDHRLIACNLKDFLFRVVPNMTGISTEMSMELNVISSLEQDFQAFKLSLSLMSFSFNKKYIPLDQLSFIGNIEKTNGSLIAAGSSGAIFGAIFKEEPVVVKFYWQKGIQKNDSPFFNEAFILDKVKKLPHVLDLNGFVYHEKAGYGLVMKRYPYTLLDFLQEKTKKETSLCLRLKLALQVSEALSAIHQLSLLHRDIRPANIFVDEDDNAIVGDFDLAVPQLFPGKCVGNRRYIAPEIYSSHYGEFPTKNTASCDIYSLGVTLYELFSNIIDPSNKGLSFDIEQPLPSEAFIERSAERLTAWIGSCLNAEPTKRPTAQKLSYIFKSAYDAQCAFDKSKEDVLPAAKNSLLSSSLRDEEKTSISSLKQKTTATDKPSLFKPNKQELLPAEKKERSKVVPTFDLSNIAYAMLNYR